MRSCLLKFCNKSVCSIALYPLDIFWSEVLRYFDTISDNLTTSWFTHDASRVPEFLHIVSGYLTRLKMQCAWIWLVSLVLWHCSIYSGLIDYSLIYVHVLCKRRLELISHSKFIWKLLFPFFSSPHCCFYGIFSPCSLLCFLFLFAGFEFLYDLLSPPLFGVFSCFPVVNWAQRNWQRAERR